MDKKRFWDICKEKPQKPKKIHLKKVDEITVIFMMIECARSCTTYKDFLDLCNANENLAKLVKNCPLSEKHLSEFVWLRQIWAERPDAS